MLTGDAGVTVGPSFAKVVQIRQDVPASKTLDDLRRLKEEIMPKVEAA